jgi:excisionase family DNA binding protein
MLTVAEVAAQLALSQRTVYRLLHSGRLAHHRIGGAIRIDPEHVEELKRGTLWPSELSSSAGSGAMPSSSKCVETVYSDGSRPARRKSRRPSLKLVSSENP